MREILASRILDREVLRYCVHDYHSTTRQLRLRVYEFGRLDLRGGICGPHPVNPSKELAAVQPFRPRNRVHPLGSEGAFGIYVEDARVAGGARESSLHSELGLPRVALAIDLDEFTASITPLEEGVDCGRARGDYGRSPCELDRLPECDRSSPAFRGGAQDSWGRASAR